MTGVWVTNDTISATRMNEKTIIQGSGSTLNGLTTYAGMVAYCTSTGSGFTVNNLYIRNAANTAWKAITPPQTLDQVYPLSVTESDYTPSATTPTATSVGKIGSAYTSTEGTASNTGTWSVSPTSLGNLDADDDLSTATGTGQMGASNTNIAYIEMDYGSSITVTKAYVKFGLWSTNQAWTSHCDVEGYNGSTWDLLASFTSISTSEVITNQTISFSSGSYSKLRYKVYNSISHVGNNTQFKAYYLGLGEIGIPDNVSDGLNTTRWKSNSENNPAIYIDTGSTQEIVGLLISVDKTNTTETQIKIRLSTDTTFTDGETVRLIDISDFTDDTDRFIIIPRQLTDLRYIQIYGVSNTVTLAINRFEYIVKTAAQFDRGHFHKFISSTVVDPSLDSN